MRENPGYNTELCVLRFEGEWRFLSNFWACAVSYNGFWPTAEHAYQSAKSADPSYREALYHAQTTGEAKRLGRTVLLRDDWEAVKVQVMLGVLQAKFSDPELGRRLEATAPMMLVEGNTWHDNYWGSCECGWVSCTFKGRNVLGQLLMTVRATL